MLETSRLYSFLDSKSGFAVHFLDGQRLIHDLALIHDIKGPAFAYLRDAFLGFMPMISFLKPGENLGIYIDSEDPYFRFKIETSHGGQTRTLLLPENFNQFPLKISGNVRVAKQFPGNKAPYTSIIEFTEADSKDLINQIIRESYQVTAEVIVSENADQSLLVIKLPPINVNQQNLIDETPSLKSYIKKHQHFFHDIFDEHHSDVQKVVSAFEEGPYAYLSSRQVSLTCPCSKEHMVHNLRMLYSADLDHLFAEGDPISVKCDYCKKNYEISRLEISQAPVQN